MLAEKIPTYEEWYDQRCNWGYDVDDEWLNGEIKWALNKVMKDSGLYNKSKKRQVLWRNVNTDVNWSVGSYDDYVTFDVGVTLRHLPDDHDLRLRFPFAFLAEELEFAYEHEIEYRRGTRNPSSLTNDFQWHDGRYVDDDETFEEGTLYDGMDWHDIARLMLEQTQDLLDVLQQYVDDACYLVQCTLRSDYDYYFSEERYLEEWS